MKDTTAGTATMPIGILGIILIAVLLAAAIVLIVRANHRDEP